MVLGTVWCGSRNACTLSLFRTLLCGRAQSGQGRALCQTQAFPSVLPRCWGYRLELVTFCVLGTHKCVASRFPVNDLA